MDNNITDTAIVASAVSAPVWLQEVNLLAGIMFAVVGTLIGLVRLYYMIKDRKDADMANMIKSKFDKVYRRPAQEVAKPKVEPKVKAEAPKKRGRPKGSTNKKS